MRVRSHATVVIQAMWKALDAAETAAERGGEAGTQGEGEFEVPPRRSAAPVGLKDTKLPASIGDLACAV